MVYDRRTGHEKHAIWAKERLKLERKQAIKAARVRELVRMTHSWPSEPDYRDTAQEEADEWVRSGVERLAEATKRDHVVLMAATEPKQGKVGVGSSVKCEAMVAMTALGALVAEVNRALSRDGVAARVFLRMKAVSDEAPKGDHSQ